MGIEKIIEVGVAVKDLDKAIELFTEVLGAKLGQTVDFEPYGMKCAMCRIGDVDFELMAPTKPDGVIGKFIESTGKGFYHIALKTDNIDEQWKHFEERGVNLAPFGRAFDPGGLHGLPITARATKNGHFHFSSLVFGKAKLEINDGFVDPLLTSAPATAVVVLLRLRTKGNILPLL
ncbi:MAG: VOC family protein [Thermodesulfobacteriota bacterium]|nr:VOC family protein [Thermodesulfobacteriota bacterium]